MTGDPELVSQWRALVASHAAVTAALEHDLGQRHGLGVTEFEVLERLAENPGLLPIRFTHTWKVPFGVSTGMRRAPPPSTSSRPE